MSNNYTINNIIEFTAKEPPNNETKTTKKLELNEKNKRKSCKKVSILQNEYLIN